jgi:hypothetical protein
VHGMEDFGNSLQHWWAHPLHSKLRNGRGQRGETGSGFNGQKGRREREIMMVATEAWSSLPWSRELFQTIVGSICLILSTTPLSTISFFINSEG